MKIKLEDRDLRIEYYRLAINMVGISIDYQTTDMIATLIRRIDDIGGDFTLKDAVRIQVECGQRWEEYFKKQKATVTLNSDEPTTGTDA